jgi:hypothetical protein
MNDPSMQLLRASDIALDYVRQGWAVVPVPFREKGPRLKGWQNLRIGTEQVVRYFRGPTNIGVILGAASGGLVDIDIDCAEAVEISGWMLPKTGAVFGRASKRGSHRLYRVAGPAPSIKLDDPVRGDTLIELRGDKKDGGAGFQTVFPGSIHPSGEPIEWADNGEPAVIEYNELSHHAVCLAMRALIARHCPGATTADEARLALAQADPLISKCIAEWDRALNGLPIAKSAPSGPQPSPKQTPTLTDAAVEQPSLPPPTAHEVARVWTMLTYINSRPRNEAWLPIGGAIHDFPGWPEELRRALWDWWSWHMDPAPDNEKVFNEAEQEKAWVSFARDYDGPPATMGKIDHDARAGGWDGHMLKPLPDELRALVPAAPDIDAGMSEDEGTELARLAAMPLFQYAKERRDAAKKLGIAVRYLWIGWWRPGATTGRATITGKDRRSSCPSRSRGQR